MNWYNYYVKQIEERADENKNKINNFESFRWNRKYGFLNFMATEKQLRLLRSKGILANDCSIAQASAIISKLADNDWNSKEDEVKKAVYKYGARYGRLPKAQSKTKEVKIKMTTKQTDKKDYVFFDLETLGLSPNNSEIVEYAGIKYQDGKEVDRLHIYVKPKQKFVWNPTKTISWDMVKDGDDIETALKKILEFQKGHTLVAHNISFDAKFLNHYLNDCFNIRLGNELECTLMLARQKVRGIKNHKLGTLIDWFGISTDGKTLHTALSDVEVMIELWHKLHEI